MVGGTKSWRSLKRENGDTRRQQRIPKWRAMKMSTIRSLWRYDAAVCTALLLPILRRSATSRYASRAAAL
jgi:hypothetical protein